MSELKKFLARIATDPKRLSKFQDNPEEAMKEAGLSPDDIEAILSGDTLLIHDRLSENPQGLTLTPPVHANPPVTINPPTNIWPVNPPITINPPVNVWPVNPPITINPPVNVWPVNPPITINPPVSPPVTINPPVNMWPVNPPITINPPVSPPVNVTTVAPPVVSSPWNWR